MNKDLPKVFASPIKKELRNNKEFYYTSLSHKEEPKEENILQKINEIFASPHHVYKSKVQIVTNEGEKEAIIVGKSGNNLLTLKGEKININDILKISKI